VTTNGKYPTEVTDRQWEILRKLLPPPKTRGRRPFDRRWVLNAIFYVARSGCQWRLLPRDFPCWSTVYGVFRQWLRQGVWQRINTALAQLLRKTAGKKPTPTAAILDSQSIRTAEGGIERGYDAGKKITGRKRHLAVDTLGLVLAVVVHAASWQDHDAAAFVLMKLRTMHQRLKVVFADSAYGRNGLPQWVQETFGWILQSVLRPVAVKGFVVLPKRWIVERTFAWLARFRRNSKDYERLPEVSEAMIYVSMIYLMSRRLSHTSK
jgi:putative transposase